MTSDDHWQPAKSPAQLYREQRDRQLNAMDHERGLHKLKRLPGCPYCYPPGPKGDYRP